MIMIMITSVHATRACTRARLICRTQGGVSLMTLASRATETHICPTFFMSENDKPGPTRRHLHHLAQGLVERLDKDGVVVVVADVPEPFDLPITNVIWVHDMAGLCNIALRQDPKNALPHCGVQNATRVVRQFTARSKYIRRSTPCLTKERIKWDLGDTTVTAGNLKGWGYDCTDVDYLRGKSSPARSWNVKNSFVDLLHGMTALRTNQMPLLASQQLAFGPKALQRYDHQLRLHGVYLRPALNYANNGVATSPKHGQLVDAYLYKDPTTLMWVDSLPDDVNVNNARLNWLEAINVRLNHMAHTEDLAALNVLCVTSHVYQTVLGIWGCSGEGTDVDARLTPSASHNRDAVPFRLGPPRAAPRVAPNVSVGLLVAVHHACVCARLLMCLCGEVAATFSFVGARRRATVQVPPLSAQQVAPFAVQWAAARRLSRGRGVRAAARLSAGRWGPLRRHWPSAGLPVRRKPGLSWVHQSVRGKNAVAPSREDHGEARRAVARAHGAPQRNV